MLILHSGFSIIFGILGSVLAITGVAAFFIIQRLRKKHKKDLITVREAVDDELGWNIRLDEIEFKDKIGTGSFGEVLLL